MYIRRQLYAHGDWSFERMLQLKMLEIFAHVVVCSFPISKCLPSSPLGANFNTGFSLLLNSPELSNNILTRTMSWKKEFVDLFLSSAVQALSVLLTNLRSLQQLFTEKIHNTLNSL